MSLFDFRLRIKNATQIVQVCSNREKYKCGKDQDCISVLTNATIIVDNLGKIAAVGEDNTIEQWLNSIFPTKKTPTFERDINGEGICVLPGFIDAHTHPVWSGNRVGEFAMKLAGATYMEVHASGGGIHSTVRATRKSSEEELRNLLLQRLDRMILTGTTLIEGKSGYGLDTETELKMLRVLHNVQHPVEVVSTFLGAHSPPENVAVDVAVRDVIEHQIPAVVKSMKEGKISPTFIDVFCEKGVFEHDDSLNILRAGKESGLEINFHGDEIHSMNSGCLGAKVGARAISHLEMLDDDGIVAMASCSPPIIGVLLPTTKYILNLPAPPVRRMIQGNVPVALGSDFNPNAHCMSMPTTMNMACVLFKMTMNESLVAATINAAASIGKAEDYGSIEVGKFADFVLLNAPRWEHVIYEMSDPPITYVIKKGAILVENNARLY